MKRLWVKLSLVSAVSVALFVGSEDNTVLFEREKPKREGGEAEKCLGWRCCWPVRLREPEASVELPMDGCW